MVGGVNDWKGAMRGFCGVNDILHFDLYQGDIGICFSKINKAVHLRSVHFMLYLVKN